MNGAGGDTGLFRIFMHDDRATLHFNLSDGGIVTATALAATSEDECDKLKVIDQFVASSVRSRAHDN
jgi:hypothetical protein